MSTQQSPAVTRMTARKVLVLAVGGALLFAGAGMALTSKSSPRQPVATVPAPIPVTTQKVTARPRLTRPDALAYQFAWWLYRDRPDEVLQASAKTVESTWSSYFEFGNDISSAK
jgi:hypothetical protein